jgi:hypothetical protein
LGRRTVAVTTAVAVTVSTPAADCVQKLTVYLKFETGLQLTAATRFVVVVVTVVLPDYGF